MKRILTLLFAAGSLTAVQAQSREDARRVILGDGNGSSNGGYGNGRDVILGGGNNGENYPSYPGNYPNYGSRQAQIDQANREYDAKIQSIRNNGYLSYEEKQRAIRQLERDRNERIQQINRSYSNGRGNGGNNDCDNDDRNNGKRNGWYKKSKNDNWRKGRN